LSGSKGLDAKTEQCDNVREEPHHNSTSSGTISGKMPRCPNLLTRFCLTLGMLSGLTSHLLAEDNVPATPEAVWAGFDPRSEPLEIKVMKRWTERGSVLTEFTFTGMTHEGSEVRVYALAGAPEGKNRLPGILHIHGGGQTVSPQWLRFWNDRGYAALTFNWGGAWPNRDKFTAWGKLTQGNHRNVQAMVMATKPSVRMSSWYLWTRVSRRALTCLEQQPSVDPDRLGIFGVSMGGTIVWPLAAMDHRVKAACAIYGVGWNTYPDELGSPDPKVNDPQTQLWRNTMESESYARLVKCPILFLSATNDQHGNMDRAFDTLARVPTETRWAFTPRYRHHIAQEQGADLPLWMDAHLKGERPFPRSPVAEIRLGTDGIPCLVVKPDGSQPIRRVDLFYAFENRNPKNRYWRSASGRPDQAAYISELPILDPRQPLFAFANVLYDSGVCLSTNLVSVVPSGLGPARATDQRTLVIDDFATGSNGWVTSSPATDPIPPVPNLLALCVGPAGKTGVTVSKPIALQTHKLGDPKWRGPKEAQLELEVHVRAPRTLRVVMHEHEFATGWTQYAAEVALEPGKGWKTITLPAEAFSTDKGEHLKGWDSVQQLELKTQGGAGEEPIYGAFRWVPVR
jgi:dienelactone hydrolase